MESMSGRLHELETRVQDIERSHQRWRSLSLVLFIMAVLMAGEVYHTTRNTKQTLEAENFVVRGSDGQKRAEFGLASLGLPQLKLYDEKGAVQVGLEAFSNSNSCLTFLDHGQTQLSLESMGDGASSLRLLNQGESSYANLYLMPMGRTGLSLTREKESVLLGTNPRGTGLVVTDSDGQESGSVGTSSLSANAFSFARNRKAERDDTMSPAENSTDRFIKTAMPLKQPVANQASSSFSLSWLRLPLGPLGL